MLEFETPGSEPNNHDCTKKVRFDPIVFTKRVIPLNRGVTKPLHFATVMA